MRMAQSDVNCDLLAPAMVMTLQAAAFSAAAAAVIGRYSSPAAAPPHCSHTCHCRYDGDGVGAEVPPLALPSVAWDWTGYAFVFFCLGVGLTLSALRCWNSTIASVQEALGVRPAVLVRPRAESGPLAISDVTRPTLW